MKERFVDVDICKGVAMLGILLMHSFIVYPINIQNQAWSRVCLNIVCSFPLAMFFMMSGYLSAFSRERRLLKDIARKFKRLMIPYLFYGLLTIVMKTVMPSLVNKHYDSLWEYTMSYLLYGGELWFLYVLFLIFLIWPIVLRHINKRLGGAILCILFAVYTLDTLYTDGESSRGMFCNKYFTWYSIFFVLGYMLKDIAKERIFNGKNLILLGIAFILFDVILIHFVSEMIVGYNLLSRIIGCLFVWCAAYRMVGHSVEKPLAFIGKQSLAFYFLNGYVLVAVRTIVVNVLHMNHSQIVVLLIFIGCVLLEYAAVVVLRRFPYTDLLIGVSK